MRIIWVFKVHTGINPLSHPSAGQWEWRTNARRPVVAAKPSFRFSRDAPKTVGG
eukprot:SAG31_NODE_38315_length_297_cov_0.772727_1_plen_53_part_01